MKSDLLRRSFTLIELLVVIAIIAILASMLLPSLSKARATARGMSCLSQLKQVGIYMQNYLSENKDTFPAIPSVDLNRHIKILVPYIMGERYSSPDYNDWPRRTAHLLICPTAADHPFLVNPYDKKPELVYSGKKVYLTSFGMNYALGKMVYNKVKNPSRIIEWMEAGSTYLYRPWYKVESGPYMNIHVRNARFRHNNTANLMFVDGHAGKIAPREDNDDSRWIIDNPYKGQE